MSQCHCRIGRESSGSHGQSSNGSPQEKRQKVDMEGSTQRREIRAVVSTDIPPSFKPTLHDHTQHENSSTSTRYPVGQLTAIPPDSPRAITAQVDAKVRKISRTFPNPVVTRTAANLRLLDGAERHLDLRLPVSSHGMQVLVTHLL